jgi:5-methylcytosine-specific restriction endonuclease McrA
MTRRGEKQSPEVIARRMEGRRGKGSSLKGQKNPFSEEHLENLRVAHRRRRLDTRDSIRYEEFRQEILDRDSRICRECGSLGDQVHHLVDEKDDPSRLFDPTNAVVFCHPCHSRITMSDPRIKKGPKLGFKQSAEHIAKRFARKGVI